MDGTALPVARHAHSSRSPARTHLQQLEADSIHIIREAVAQSDNPVMLYSIGKDSSVLLRLALKAFYPGKLPFPLLHIDTTWKFRDMIAFRDKVARELGLDIIVHINESGLARGVGPISHGSAVHTDIMKTQALRQALDKYEFDAALGGARRDEESSREGARLLVSQRASPLGSQAPAPRAVAALQWPQAQRRKHTGLPAFELDRARRLALHPSAANSGRPALFRSTAPGDPP
jgi:3'-phosphoadenosine 5'-phosphosulfate sulfotransferase (PAPS reductase)/FAD synthetase